LVRNRRLVTLTSSRGIIPIVLVVVSAGCTADIFNKDAKTVNAFSHAYTGFRDAAYDAWIGMAVLSSDPDPFGYWKQLQAALDVRSTNGMRLQHALSATSILDTSFPKAMESLGNELDKMDRAVLRMVETANSIRNVEYREHAIEAAKAARDMHTAFVRVRNLWDKRLAQQSGVLRDLVGDGGQMRATLLFKSRGEEAKATTQQLDAAGSESAAALQRVKDAFSALTGKSQLKAYQLKEDLDEKKDSK
jgi:hypothetical protein